MDSAKATVKDFLNKSGHHDTTVHEKTAPAVTSETVNKHRHEETTTAIDREVHQDHYHTTVQPVVDREISPEEHKHRVIPVEHREHHHGKGDAVKDSLAQEKAHFHDTRVEGSTKETHSNLPVVSGEHVHHHVHETIQPVVQKETIQPSVVHTTVPIHEVHHNDPKHHAASALPAVSMADFQKQGGGLHGREERYDGFEGEPKKISAAMAGTHLNNNLGSNNNTTTGPHDSKLANKADPTVDSDRDGSRNAGLAQTSGSAGAAQHPTTAGNKTDPRIDSGYDAGLTQTTHTGTNPPVSGHAMQPNATTQQTLGSNQNYSTGHTEGIDSVSGDPKPEKKKTSLLAKLNPRKDADGDGKKGLMD